MPRLKDNEVPSYRLHKQSGQAIVTLNGRDILLGRHKTAASKAEYNRQIAEWIANGRRLPGTKPDLTISGLMDAFRIHAERYYIRPDGQQTSEVANFRQALRPLRCLYGATCAAEFGPLALETVRNHMITSGWCRRHINSQIARVKLLFKWGASRELLPATVHQALTTVAGLRSGRSEAIESEPVKPVPDEIVNATLEHLGSTVRAMVQIQRLTGARPGEICAMKMGDVDRSGEIWIYRPAFHKTQRFGHERTIYLGKRGQAVLRPFLLKTDPSASIFSPADAVAEMRERRSARRKTPINCGNVAGSNRRRYPKRQPGNLFTVDSYRRAITRAADDADEWAKAGHIVGNDERIIPRWHPHQLRHSTATEIRRQFGIEAAQHVLGHTTLAVTQIYAEKNADIAKRVAAVIG
jgi:integrase